MYKLNQPPTYEHSHSEVKKTLDIFPQRHTNGQLVYEKVFHTTDHQENANENYEIPTHTR